MTIFLMMHNRTRLFRATTWLCLVAAVLVSLLPADGVIVCLGSDGHVALGSTAGADECPCTRVDSAQEPSLDDRSRPHHGHEAPCNDLQLDPPEIVADSGFARSLTAPERDSFDDVIKTIGLRTWTLDCDFASRWRPTRLTCPADPLPREQHVYKRVIALVI